MPAPSMSPTRAFRLGSGSLRVRGGGTRAFSLVEMLVATVILALIMVLITSFTSQTGKIWKKSSDKIQAFQGARAAYDEMTSRLSQAVLNPYLDYYDSTLSLRTPANATTFIPATYARNSDLHFIVDRASTLVPDNQADHPGQAVFFVAPFGYTETASTFGGIPSLLNACGYYVEFNTDKPNIPTFLTGLPGIKERHRYRLMEFLQPTESLAIYSLPATGQASKYGQWYTNFLPPKTPLSQAPLRMLAENIIVLVILPELSPRDAAVTAKVPAAPLAPRYTYDSRAGTINTVAHDQLPPLLRVAMVAIDETSAQHLAAAAGTAPPGFLEALLQGGGALFQQASQLDADLASLSDALIEQHVEYRIFDTDIALRGARWSTQ